MLCKNCGKELTGRKYSFCCIECNDEYISWFNYHKSKKYLNKLKCEIAKENMKKIRELECEIRELKGMLRNERNNKSSEES